MTKVFNLPARLDASSPLMGEILESVEHLVEKMYHKGHDGADIDFALRTAVAHVFRNERRLEADEVNRS